MSSEEKVKRKRTPEEKHKHRLISRAAREKHQRLLQELSTFFPQSTTQTSANGLLQLAADRLEEIRHRSSTTDRSHLTADEKHFLLHQSSNGFLFLTQIVSNRFPIVFVNESIGRVLQISGEQWLNQDFSSFLHPDDFEQVQRQLILLNGPIGTSIHFRCRLKTSNENFVTVEIDGMTKFVDHLFNPVGGNQTGTLVFVAFCHRPLIDRSKELNVSLQKSERLLKLHCRCSPFDWRIFLVDSSTSTWPNVSLINKSILDFLLPSERDPIDRDLCKCATTSISDITSCHLIDPVDGSVTLMTLEIQPIVNPVRQQTDFVELVFENLFDVFSDLI